MSHPLAARVDGPVFEPADGGYARECATHNLLTPLEPAVVVGAASVRDVRAAVRFAAASGRGVAVLGGGHFQPDPARDMVLINLSRMSRVTVDPARRTARIEGGALWSDVLDAATPHGLAPTLPSHPGVGAIGYCLGGGVSPVLGRTLGYACEHVHRLEVVTADGSSRTVTAAQEPDLFFALRGSTGNFGVVTAMEISLFPMSLVYGGGLFYSGEFLADVLHGWRRWVTRIPADLTSSLAVLRPPADPALPPVAVHVRLAYLGGRREAERLIAPLRGLAPVLLDTLAALPIEDTGAIHLDPPGPLAYLHRSLGLRELTSDTARTLIDLVGPGSDSPLRQVEIRALGGALDTPPTVPDAVPSRGLPFELYALAGPEGGAHLAELIDALGPWEYSQCLVTLYAPGAPHNVRALYGPALYDRLSRIKGRYDPGNLFRANHTILPSTGNFPRRRPS